MSPVEPTSELRLQLEREANELAREFEGVFDAATVREQVLLAAQRPPVQTLADVRVALARTYAREALRSMARGAGRADGVRPRILFVCVQNAGRSQMAAAFARALGRGRVDVRSAGSSPADKIHSNVLDAMNEVGIDLAEAHPKLLADELVRAADAVVTMGCGDSCPVFSGTRYEDWDVADPSGKPVERVREIRDEIRARVVRLLETLGVDAP